MTMTATQFLKGLSDNRPVRREADGSSFLLHCSGGVRAARVDARRELWIIEPFLIDGVAQAKGVLTRKQLRAIVSDYNLKPIAFEDMGWIGGAYWSGWTPIIPGKANNSESAAVLWTNIASKFYEARTGRATGSDTPSDPLDGQSEEEKLAGFIGLSLRSMDISVSNIAEFYNEQLVNLLSKGATAGLRVATTLDQALYSHVQTFFMHAGAVRDYLAWLIGVRLGLDVDALNRLGTKLRPPHFAQDSLAREMKSQGLIVPHSTKPSEWVAGGWLKDMGELRNTFVHKRPFGSSFDERWGMTRPIDADAGLYRYVRPVAGAPSGGPEDILDLVAQQYHLLNQLFEQMARLTGYDARYIEITDADIVAENS